VKRTVALVAALLLAGCGGGGDDVPADAVAVVDGVEIPKSDYEALVAQTRTSYKSQKREFPTTGSQEFRTLKNQFVQYLVQRQEFEQEAKALDIDVTEKQVAARLTKIQKQYFGGDKAKYEQQLRQQGLTEAAVRKDLRAQIVSEKIFADVTKTAKVTDAEIDTFYARNSERFSRPATRDVRHILVKTKAKADDLYAQLKAGGDFAALAKKFSQDTGSKENGGKLTVSRGHTVPAFDEAAFALKVNELSRPVKTEFGFHVIQALSAVTPAKTPPLQDVQDSIRSQLLQTKKNDAMTAWVNGLKKRYAAKVSYATGFAPPATTSTAATTTG
jgi:parvulin-like peptidyl-prolyl isomerase